MVAIPLILLPIAFAGGLWGVARLAPPLAPTPRGDLAARVVDLLGGAAAAVVVLNVYNAIRAATEDAFRGFSLDTTVAQYAIEALWQGGLLVAAAAVVHALAPAADADD